MNTDKFKGVFPALLTPFDREGKVNDKAVADLIELNVAKGVDGFYVGGSTGEGLLLTVEERKQLFRAAAKANSGRTTMIAHVGTICTEHAVDMARCAQAEGYDAISAVAPYYYAFGYDAVKQYYSEIADSVDLPMIIYNFPAANGFQFTKEYAEEFFRNPKFIGIKHTNADLFRLQQFKTMSCNPIVYNGFDEMFVAGLSMGADGGIGSTYNFMAEKFIEIYRKFRSGDMSGAQKVQFDANQIISELIRYGVFAMEKGILSEMGIDMGECRKPFLPLSQEGREACKRIAKSL